MEVARCIIILMLFSFIIFLIWFVPKLTLKTYFFLIVFYFQKLNYDIKILLFFSRARATVEPIYPAPPVIKILFFFILNFINLIEIKFN